MRLPRPNQPNCRKTDSLYQQEYSLVEALLFAEEMPMAGTIDRLTNSQF